MARRRSIVKHSKKRSKKYSKRHSKRHTKRRSFGMDPNLKALRDAGFLSKDDFKTLKPQKPPPRPPRPNPKDYVVGRHIDDII